MDDICRKCGIKECDCTSLCATCYEKKNKLDENFDWNKVLMVWSKCERCGQEPILFVYPEFEIKSKGNQ